MNSDENKMTPTKSVASPPGHHFKMKSTMMHKFFSEPVEAIDMRICKAEAILSSMLTVGNPLFEVKVETMDIKVEDVETPPSITEEIPLDYSEVQPATPYTIAGSEHPTSPQFSEADHDLTTEHDLPPLIERVPSTTTSSDDPQVLSEIQRISLNISSVGHSQHRRRHLSQSRVSPYNRGSIPFDRSPRRDHLSPDHQTYPSINTSPYPRIAENEALESGSGEHWEGTADMWTRAESCKQSLMDRNAARRLKFERKDEDQQVVIKTERDGEMDQRISLAENTSHLISNPLMAPNSSPRSNSHFLSVPQECATRSSYSPQHSMSPRDHNLNHSPHHNYPLPPNHGVSPHISETATFSASCQQPYQNQSYPSNFSQSPSKVPYHGRFGVPPSPNYLERSHQLLMEERVKSENMNSRQNLFQHMGRHDENVPPISGKLKMSEKPSHMEVQPPYAGVAGCEERLHDDPRSSYIPGHEGRSVEFPSEYGIHSRQRPNSVIVRNRVDSQVFQSKDLDDATVSSERLSLPQQTDQRALNGNNCFSPSPAGSFINPNLMAGAMAESVKRTWFNFHRLKFAQERYLEVERKKQGNETSQPLRIPHGHVPTHPYLPPDRHSFDALNTGIQPSNMQMHRPRQVSLSEKSVSERVSGDRSSLVTRVDNFMYPGENSSTSGDQVSSTGITMDHIDDSPERLQDQVPHFTATKGKRGRPRKHAPKLPLPPLYVFIRNLLHNPAYNPSVVSWVDDVEGCFKVTSTTEFARTWGKMKSNRSEEMNYEKMSRAMRYHYGSERQGRKGHLAMVKEKRLFYRFGELSVNWRHHEMEAIQNSCKIHELCKKNLCLWSKE